MVSNSLSYINICVSGGREERAPVVFARYATGDPVVWSIGSLHLAALVFFSEAHIKVFVYEIIKTC